MPTATHAPSAVTTPTIEPPVDERVYRQLFDKTTLKEYLGISVDTIDRLIKAGHLRALHIGNQVRFTLEDVDDFIERCRVPAQDAQ